MVSGVVVVVISGPPGSGKSTVAKEVARKLGLRYLSAGKIFREMAKELNVDVIQLNEEAVRNPQIDLEIDRRTLEEAKRGNVVIEGHLTAWIARPYADLCVYLTAPLKVRAERIAKREGKEIEKVLKEMTLREELHMMRFKMLYGIDIRDLSPFDLVVNTENVEPEKIVKMILLMLGRGEG